MKPYNWMQIICSREQYLLYKCVQKSLMKQQHEKYVDISLQWTQFPNLLTLNNPRRI